MGCEDEGEGEGDTNDVGKLRTTPYLCGDVVNFSTSCGRSSYGEGEREGEGGREGEGEDEGEGKGALHQHGNS